MNLKEADLLKFIPQFMRDDKNAKAFVYAINKQLENVVSNIKHAAIYSRIDDLTEEVLDELAWQFNITEYNVSYDIQQKRNLIKNCLLVHHQRGTVGAVEKVVNNVFGDARVVEWFDYGGKPYHFKVFTSNASADDNMLAEFDRLIKITQNCRSHLESAIVELYQNMNIKTGIVCSISCIDKFICE